MPSAYRADCSPGDDRDLKRSIALVVAAAFFIQNLDAGIINTSAPQMARSFAVTALALNAGTTAYILTLAAFVPVSGWLADRFGARSVFAAAIATFTIASIGCAAAASLPQFVAARLLQGMGGALMTPIGRMIVVQTTRKDRLLQATAFITWPALIAPVAAPVLGGAITTLGNWRWNFLLNVPVGLIEIILVLLVIPERRTDQRRGLDLPGWILTAITLSSLIYGLGRLAADPSPWTALAILLGSGVSGVAATCWFGRSEAPLLDLTVLRIPSFAVAALDAGNLMRLSMSAVPFLLPLSLQLVWRLSPLGAGEITLVYFMGNFVMKAITTPLLQRLGFRTILIANGLAVAASTAACALVVSRPPMIVTYAILFLSGAFRSLQFTAITTLTFADIPDAQANASSTFASMTQQVATAVGVTAGAVLLHWSQGLRGGVQPDAPDFRFAFVAVGLCAAAGVLLAWRLHPDAGHVVSGRARRHAIDATDALEG